MKGFSRVNPMYMRAFADAWHDGQIVQQPVGRTRLVYESENDTLFNFFYLPASGELGSILLADSS